MVEKRSAKENVTKAFRALAHHYGVALRDKDLPEVEVKEGNYSYYNPLNKTIYIEPSEVNNGAAIFEESSHALRDLVQRRRGKNYDQQDSKVQEFFGRAADTVGREIAKEAELNYLEWENPRDMNSPETRVRHGERLKKARTVLNAVRKTRRELEDGENYLRETTRNSQQNILASLRDYEHGRTPLEALREKVDSEENSYRRAISTLKKQKPNAAVGDEDIKVVKFYLEEFSYLRDVIDIASKSSDDGKKDCIRRAEKTLGETFGSSLYKFDNASLITQRPSLTALEEWKSISVHRAGYKAAEKCSAPQLLGRKNLYELSDEEVKKEFFSKKHSKLEEMALCAGIFAGFFGSFVLMSTNLTGNTISNLSSTSSSWLGEFLFVVGLVSCFLLLKLKKN